MRKLVITICSLVIVVVLVVSIFIILNSGPEEDRLLPKSSLITPYVYEANITQVGPYSSTPDCPWGFIHGGLDFFAGNNSPFQAVTNCTLSFVDKFFNSGNGLWQVNLLLEYNSSVSFGYAFEPFSPNESDADQQLAMITQPEGATLSQGDILGSLLALGPSAHVDWYIKFKDNFICPESYFTPAANQSIMNGIWNFNASWPMCFC
jgi:hypothetical protein